jgi:intein/homing endonuclease
MKIKKITKEEYNGVVYNLGVNKTHTYFVNNMLVHNCYMDSKENDKHYSKPVKKINNFFGQMTENQRPFQVACLGEFEYVFTTKGLKYIKDIEIGDFVYNECGEKVKVINKIKNNKNLYLIQGNKGFKIKATLDHKFQTLNGLKEVVELDIDDELSCANFTKREIINHIDLANYINPTSRKKK